MNSGVTDCRACPRLVEWRERVAVEKRAAFVDREYWGRPVPDFGDPEARLLVVGLAPAAHGANRTGRMFTGDRSGDPLASLHRTGFANQPASEGDADALELRNCLITASLHCAPPANKPFPEELENCTRWLLPVLARPEIKVVVGLGGIAFRQVIRVAGRIGWGVPSPRPRFAHSVEMSLAGGPMLVGSYHPSQQNTFTGRLTEPMLDAVFLRAGQLLEVA